MVRYFPWEKSLNSSVLGFAAVIVLLGKVHFYALLQDHYLVRLTVSAPFSATPRPCYWSHQQRWCQRHVFGPESHGQCRRASQYQTHPEVFANIFLSCSFITKQNSCWCCVGLKENCKKRPCKSNCNYYLNKCLKGYGLGLLSASGITKPSGNVSNSGQASQFTGLPLAHPANSWHHPILADILGKSTLVAAMLSLMAVSPSPVHCAPSNIFIFSDSSHVHISCLAFCSPCTVLEALLTRKLWATQWFSLPPVGKGDHPPGLSGQHACSQCPNGGLCCSLWNQACSSNSNSSGQLAAHRAQPASCQFCIFTHEDFGSRQDPTAL